MLSVTFTATKRAPPGFDSLLYIVDQTSELIATDIAWRKLEEDHDARYYDKVPYIKTTEIL